MKDRAVKTFSIPSSVCANGSNVNVYLCGDIIKGGQVKKRKKNSRVKHFAASQD